jgi:hypothetical protein
MMKQRLRRDLLKTMGAGAIIAGVNGCVPVTSNTAQYKRPYSRKP